MVAPVRQSYFDLQLARRYRSADRFTTVLPSASITMSQKGPVHSVVLERLDCRCAHRKSSPACIRSWRWTTRTGGGFALKVEGRHYTAVRVKNGAPALAHGGNDHQVALVRPQADRLGPIPREASRR